MSLQSVDVVVERILRLCLGEGPVDGSDAEALQDIFMFFLSRMTSAFKKQRNCCNFLDQKVAWNAYGVQVER